MRRLVQGLVLCVGGIAGLLGVAFAVTTMVFGLSPVVVTSGSMSPSIDAGSLAFTRTVDADELAVGDIVSVADATGRRVMHRIDSIAGRGTDSRTVTLRGDTNRAPDVEPYVVDEADRVVASIGAAGYALAWLSGPGWVLTIGVFVVLALLAGPGSRSLDDRPAGRRTTRWAANAVAVAVSAAALATVVNTVQSSRAAWTDQGTAASGAFAAHTVQRPTTAPTCTNQGGALGLLGYAQLTWPHRDTRYAYQYTITRVTDGVQVATGTVTTAVAAGGTVTLDVRSNLITGLVANVNFDVTIRSALAASPSWTSALSWTTRVHSANLLVGLSMQCG